MVTMQAFQREHLQQLLWHRGDLVRLVVRGDLPQHHALLAAPGADHVQGRLAAGADRSERAHDLAIDGDNALATASENLAMNCWNAAPEPTQGSSRRNKRLKVSWLGKPFSSLRKPRRNGSFAAANLAIWGGPDRRTARCTSADQQQFVEIVQGGIAGPRVSSNSSKQATN